ncbi:MAG: hypothetical protein ABIF77_03315 [bacterium]
MSEHSGDGAMDAEVRFFGIVTASVTHELNNINSTIEQIAGLLGDDLARAANGQPPAPDRLHDIQARLVNQAQRATATIERLNRFAHTTDEPRGHLELRGLLENLVDLCRRLAGLHRVELVCDFPPDELWISCQPFLLQRVVFHCLSRLWLEAPSGEVILLTLERNTREVFISICGPPPPPGAKGAHDALLDDMVAALPGSVRRSTRDGRPTIVIGLPDVLAPGSFRIPPNEENGS